MNVLENLLAATDLSEYAMHAIQRGFLLAQASGAQYGVMHVVEQDRLTQLGEFIGENLMTLSQKVDQDARDALAAMLADPEKNRGVSASLFIAHGTALKAIAQHAADAKASLILIGAHGAGFFERVLIGSTASRLLRKSPIPVLIVKQPPTGPYRRVLVAVDFSPRSASLIAAARQVAPEAELVLLHVFDLPFEGKLRHAGVDEQRIYQYRSQLREQARKKLHQLARAAGLPDLQTLVIGGDPSADIVQQENELDCDLIVLGKHGFHITEEWLLGSVTKKVLARSQADVLVIPDQARRQALA